MTTVSFQAPGLAASPGGKKTRKKRTEPKNCTAGYTCGKACINRDFVCTSTLSAEGQKLAGSFADQVKRIAGRETADARQPEPTDVVAQRVDESATTPSAEEADRVIDFLRRVVGDVETDGELIGTRGDRETGSTDLPINKSGNPMLRDDDGVLRPASEIRRKRQALQDAIFEIKKADAFDDSDTLFEDAFGNDAADQIAKTANVQTKCFAECDRFDLGMESEFKLPKESNQDDADRVAAAVDEGILTEDEANSFTDRLGSGGYGTVFGDRDGNVVKIGEGSQREIDATQRASDLGIGPKVIGTPKLGQDEPNYFGEVSNQMAMKMENLKKQGFEDFKSRKDSLPQDVKDKAMAEAITNLIRLADNGFIHTDDHSENLMVNEKGETRWIDYGQTRSTTLEQLADATSKENQELADALSYLISEDEFNLTSADISRLPIKDTKIKRILKELLTDNIASSARAAQQIARRADREKRSRDKAKA